MGCESAQGIAQKGVRDSNPPKAAARNGCNAAKTSVRVPERSLKLVWEVLPITPISLSTLQSTPISQNTIRSSDLPCSTPAYGRRLRRDSIAEAGA